ncbi:CBS domain-containing protein [Methanohalophilus levihalophilus]|uniref:CBS domain-containing protein n=1 Tax=Methanohalophilus levihalophilus TaxID=1431282 RepID=UPI001AE15896|nr:CBS domain-containing protein [Methanohalophilus levihalophilus]MBP2029932.1 CBS domain-containing protein [Methanohalophilus levihalophilus]
MKDVSIKERPRKDPRAFTSESVLDQGPVQFHDRISQHEGDIMSIATRDVVTAQPTTPIIDALKTMTKGKFRHMPITDAGTNRLEGIISSFDVIDLFGGGDKSLFVEKKFKGNLLASINAEIRGIMQHEVHSLPVTSDIGRAFELMTKNNVGSIPIVDRNGQVVAICTERDFLGFMSGLKTDIKVRQYMKEGVETADYSTSLWNAAKIMVKGHFKRLPVVKDGILVGIITAFDIMKYIGEGEAFEKLVTGNVHEAFDEPVSSLIARDVVWTDPETDLGKAAEIMNEKGIGSLPVIENGELKGIITERDILIALAKHT